MVPRSLLLLIPNDSYYSCDQPSADKSQCEIENHIRDAFEYTHYRQITIGTFVIFSRMVPIALTERYPLQSRGREQVHG